MTDAATAFRRLHEEGLLRLPNAWDAASARLAEVAGAPAIATSSAAVAWTLGWADGDRLPLSEHAAAVARIVRVVKLPVSADIEGGYADNAAGAADAALRMIDAGAVGINIEDGTAAPDLLAQKIEAIRSAAARAGVALFVNARTDVYLRALVDPAERVAETLRRAALYRSAGADGLFVPALVDEDAIKAVVGGCGLPLNLLAWTGLPSPLRLEALGVRRYSAGSSIAQRSWAFVAGEISVFFGGSREESALEYGSINALYA